MLVIIFVSKLRQINEKEPSSHAPKVQLKIKHRIRQTESFLGLSVNNLKNGHLVLWLPNLPHLTLVSSARLP